MIARHAVQREVAESALAHTLGGVEAAYNRVAIVERHRKVTARWASNLIRARSAAGVPSRLEAVPQ